MHVNTIQKSSQTYTMDELQQLMAAGKLDTTKITDVSVFNKSADESACKDGKDDGKIGFFEGLKETVTGAVKGVVNGIKGCFTDEDGNFSLGKTLKSALTVGACFIPGVGPFIAGGLCAYGAVKGATGLAKGISAAANATTDAEKRAAFQSIGANGVATAASVAGLKGSVGAIAKNAGIQGGIINSVKANGLGSTAKQIASGATNYYSSAWSSASGSTLSKIGQVAKGTVVDTAGNVVGAAKAAGSAVKNSKVGKAVTNAGHKIAGSKPVQLAAKAGGKVGGAAAKVGGKIANSGVGQKVGGAAAKVGGKIANSGIGQKVGGAASKVSGAVKGFASDVSTAAANGYTGIGSTPLYGGLAFASTQVGDVATNLDNNILTASQTYATVNSQSGYEYDLQDYNVMTDELLNQKYSAIMNNARAIQM